MMVEQPKATAGARGAAITLPPAAASASAEPVVGAAWRSYQFARVDRAQGPVPAPSIGRAPAARGYQRQRGAVALIIERKLQASL
jgi:hypothetical protein